MAAIRLALLGTFGASCDGRPLALPTRKAEALLAFLACRPGGAHQRDRLTALLWGDRADAQARHSLSQTLLSLRRALGDRSEMLVAERDSVALAEGAAEIDVMQFRRHATDQDAAALRAALALYRGPLLDGFGLRAAGFEEWLAEERSQLHALAIDAALRLADCSAGDDAAAAGALNRALALDPLSEEVHRRLMRLSLERGAYNEAIRQYRRCVELLRRELDTAPEPTTTALHRQALEALKTATISVSPIVPGAPVQAPAPDRPSARRASVAVMPFLDPAGPPGISGPAGSARAGLAGGLTHDVITRLAKLRSLFVIAQGTVFALAEKGIDTAQAGEILGVDYVAGGSIARHADRIVIGVELVDCPNAHIVWTDSFEFRPDDTFEVLERIGNAIVAAIAGEIEAAERNRAILRPPNSLDSWQALHRGLWHMYRFTAEDNARAHRFFQMSVRLDPTFSRAHAGLSFTHFQNAFLLRPQGEREREIGCAIDAAAQALIADDRDPAAHWAMGRALWLQGRLDQSMAELEAATELSPNFALAQYSLAFHHSQAGDARAAIGLADLSRDLSPFDPMLFAMLATRALAHMRLGDFAAAADWAVKSAARPNAHAHIMAIAAGCLSLAGRLDEARAFARRIQKTHPQYGIADFLGSFRFAPDAEALFRQQAPSIGWE